MLNSDYNLDLTFNEKYDIINSTSFLEPGKEDEIIRIIQLEEDCQILNKIKERISDRKDFYEDGEITPFLDVIREKDELQKIILWNLLLRNTLVTENTRKRALVADELKTSSDHFLKAYAVEYDNVERVFNIEQRKEIFGGENELKLWEISAHKTLDVVNNAIGFFSSRKTSDSDFYSKMTNFLLKIKEINQSHIQQFLENLLKQYPFFPSDNPLLTLFKQFSEVEEVLLTSINQYRNHITHTLNVYLLGALLNAIDAELSPNTNDPEWGKMEASSFLCWILSAFFHDIGYSIERLNSISEKIEENLKKLGTVRQASFSLSDSSRILGERLLNTFHQEIKPEESQYDSLMLEPLLLTWDERRHGTMSAIIFWRVIDQILNQNKRFLSVFEMIDWRRAFHHAALAMTIHTFPPTLEYGLLVDNALFPSFILRLIDEVEYIDRPIFKSLEADVFERDIKINFHLAVYYTIYRVRHIRVTIEYEKCSDLRSIAVKIRDALVSFYSKQWALTIVLKDIDKELVIYLYLLKAEEEEFKKYCSLNSLNENSKAYHLFQKSIKPEGILEDDWLLVKPSPQIKHSPGYSYQ